jgi:topoisomerase-4 subunit A
VKEFEFDLSPLSVSSRSAKGLTVTKWPVRAVQKT